MKAAPAVIATLALLFIVQTCRQQDSAAGAREQWFRADSAGALADSGFKMYGAAKKVIGVMRDGYVRRMVQEKQKRDALDKALKLERKVNVVGSVVLAPLDTTLSAPVTDVDDVRSAIWNLRKEPYTITASATLPPPPAQALIEMRIRLDTLRWNLRVSCGPRGFQGLRTANAVVLVPRWATVSLDTLSQTREVCNPPPPKKKTVRDVFAVVGVVAAIVKLIQVANP